MYNEEIWDELYSHIAAIRRLTSRLEQAEARISQLEEMIEEIMNEKEPNNDKMIIKGEKEK